MVERVQVGIIGVGVSSVKLLQKLQSNSYSYKAVTKKLFGVWDEIRRAGINFDLVTTVEATNYSNWNYDYEKLPFHTAKGYIQKLESEIWKSIEPNIMKGVHVSRVLFTGNLYQLFDADNTLVLECEHLVHSVGFLNDPNVLPNLQKCQSIKDSEVLIKGFSDTSNLWISRLVLNNNKIVVASDHFCTLDKVLPSKDGWIPFDQLEPYQYLMSHNEMRHSTVFWRQLVSPSSGSTMLGKLWRWKLGLSSLFESVPEQNYKESLWKLFWRKGVPSGMFLPVKYWPVNAYASYYKEYSDFMISNGIYLNDIYLFILLGIVKVMKHSNIVKQEDGCYLLKNGGESDTTFRPDVVMGSGKAEHFHIPISYNGKDICYDYRKYLYGIWNKSFPNLYFLGTTRPTTGSFGSQGEMGCLLAFELIHQQTFRAKMTKDYDNVHSEWIRNNIGSSECDIDIYYTDYTGQYCERIAKLLGRTMTFKTAWSDGMLDAWSAGPNNMLRYMVESNPSAKESYKKLCDRFIYHEAKRVQFEFIFPHIFLVNLSLIVFGKSGMASILLLAALCTPTPWGLVYFLVERAVRVLTMPGWISYTGEYAVLRMVWPWILVWNGWKLGGVMGGILPMIGTSLLMVAGVCFPKRNFWESGSVFAMVILTVVCCVIFKQVNDTFNGVWIEFCLLDSGFILGFLASSFEIVYMLCSNKPVLFNDIRGKLRFREWFDTYIADVKKFRESCDLKTLSTV